MKIKTALDLTRCKTPGTHPAGQCLYLQVRAAPMGDEPDRVTKRWIARVTVRRHEGKGRTRDMGLGSAGARSDLTLARARDRAAELRKLARAGIDPIEDRDAKLKAAATEQTRSAAKAVTFDQCRDAFIAAHEAEWHGTKHRQQFLNSLGRYVTPVFGNLPVGVIDTPLVLKVLEPIWVRDKKIVTADRIRNRMERVLDFAKSRGYRDGDNPARWKGLLKYQLPLPSKAHTVEHFSAMPYDEIGSFMSELRKREGVDARALELLILTSTRLNETVGARWEEISLAEKLWTIPPERMKGAKGRRREHWVPLSDAAVKLLKRIAEQHEGEFIFPGTRRTKLPFTAIRVLLHRMNCEYTAHGFRSTFRTWAAETTPFPREICEMALAHGVGDATERAYQRGDLFEKRRKLMDDWASFCSRPPAKVLEFVKKRRGAASQ
jgi:integrase